MLFKNFDYNGTQILEGIDKIKVMLQPAIYPFLDYGKGQQINSRTAVSLVHNRHQFPTADMPIFYTKYYVYLNIQGEYIDHTLNMKVNISNALVLLIQKGVLNFGDGQFDNNADLLFIIYNNLYLFVRGISEVEFFADFRPECIRIAKNTKIIETSDISAFNRFKKLPMNDRAEALIHYKHTYYSYDYKSNRDSTIIFYNRAKRLLEQGNVYPKQVIEANPYKMRIEFRLKKNNNYKLLAVENLNGNYLDIFNSYMGLLTARFRKYFYGLVQVDSAEHLLFNLIYKGAGQDSKIRNTKSVLKSSLDEKILYREVSDEDRLRRLFDLFKKERNRKGVIQDIPDSMFANINKPNKIHTHTPHDSKDKSKIFYEDDDFTIFNDDFVGPDGNYIPIPENNEGTDDTTNNDFISDDDIMNGKFHTPHDSKDKSKIFYKDKDFTIFNDDFIYPNNKDKY